MSESNLLHHLYVCIRCTTSFWALPPGFDKCTTCRSSQRKRVLSLPAIVHQKKLTAVTSDIPTDMTNVHINPSNKNKNNGDQFDDATRNYVAKDMSANNHLNSSGISLINNSDLVFYTHSTVVPVIEINLTNDNELVYQENIPSDSSLLLSHCSKDELNLCTASASIVTVETIDYSIDNTTADTTDLDDISIFDDLAEDFDANMTCIICQQCLADFTGAERESHILGCVEDMEASTARVTATVKSDPTQDTSPTSSTATATTTTTTTDNVVTWGMRSEDYFCAVCGCSLARRNLTARCVHLKRCARMHGVGTRELLQMIAPPVSGDWWDMSTEETGTIDVCSETTGEPETTYIEETLLMSQSGSGGGFNIGGDSDVLAMGHALSPSSSSSPVSTSTSGPKNAFSLLMSSARKLSSSNGAGGNGSGRNANSVTAMPPPPSRQIENRAVTPTNMRGGRVRDRTGRGGRGRGTGTGQESRASPSRVAPPYKLVQGSGMSRPIVVDGFQFSSPGLSQTYFLTHFHSDHYGGLNKRFDAGQIFCSPATAALVRLRLGVQGNATVVPLEMETRHSISVPGGSFQVQLMDANHCPGAVVLLFTFKDGKQVLHTGDFRWSRALLKSSQSWKDLAASGGDMSSVSTRSPLVVYLDTTYCDTKYDFPPQDTALQAVVQCVREELSKGGSPLFIFGAYGIGKERVYMTVAEELDMMVFVDKTRWRGMLCFDWPAHKLARLTTDASLASIWVAPLGQINFKSIVGMKAKKSGCTHVIGFQPTGWTFSGSGGREGSGGNRTEGSSILSTRQSGRDVIYSVPYSEHSSFGELIDFLRIFRPEKIIPTVGANYTFKSEQQVELLMRQKDIFIGKY
eukprot:gene4781-9512_t